MGTTQKNEGEGNKTAALRYDREATEHAENADPTAVAREAASDVSEQQRAIELLQSFDVAMATTRRPDGTLAARPMFIARIDDHGVMWLLTRFDAGLADEIKHDSRVCMALRRGGRFMSVSAEAEVQEDAKALRELWQESFRVWFPEGLAQTDAVLIRLVPIEAEFWDESAARGLRFAWEAAKAFIQGESARGPATHAKVRLREDVPSPPRP